MGVLVSFISALFFGLNNATARRGVVTATAQQAILVTVSVNVALFLVIAACTGQLMDWYQLTLRQTLLLVGAGIINYVIGRYCNYRSIKIIGAVRAGPILQLGMLIPVVAGVALLHEPLSLMQMLGVLLILIGSLVVVLRRGVYTNTISSKHLFEGYAFALLGSIGYGTAPVLIRVSTNGTRLGILSGLVAFFGAQLLLLCFVAVSSRHRRIVRSLKWANTKWLILTGIINGFAQMALFIALTMAPVSLVVPIQRTSVVFRVIFSFILNREIEDFNKNVIFGTLLSVIGAMALSIFAL